MRLTTKGRYAVTAMLDLSINAGSEPVTLNDISQRQDISLPYLEQLFAKLRKRKLVSSIRGPGGGYRLGRDQSEIDIAEIIEAVSEPIDSTKCQGRTDCQRGGICLTHHLWEDLSAEIHDYLSSITLADLVAREEIDRIARQQHARCGLDKRQDDASGASGERRRGIETIVTSST